MRREGRRRGITELPSSLSLSSGEDEFAARDKILRRRETTAVEIAEWSSIQIEYRIQIDIHRESYRIYYN